MKHGIPPVLAALLISLSAAASAGEAILYEQDDFRGRIFAAQNTIDNLANYGFNDKAASIIVRGGTWQFCVDAYFRGRCVTLNPGNYGSLAGIGMSDRISSLRETVDFGTSPGAVAKIALYDLANFGGPSMQLDNTLANFDRTGFNDRATSAIISAGTWQLCEHADFRGTCYTFPPGRYPHLGQLAGQVSSARPVGESAGNAFPGQSGAGAPGWGNGGRAILYDGPNLTGRTFVIGGSVLSNLDRTGFNDRAASLRIENGYWLFCTDANFEGECRTFGPGDYPTLPWGFSYKISSGRRINNNYPYDQSPNWQRPPPPDLFSPQQ